MRLVQPYCEAMVQDGHTGKKVEYIKVFMNHQIVFEKQI